MNVILDTNVYLHYDFAAADWSQLVSAPHVTIWFTWVNLHELDHIKDSHRSLKRRERARDILKHVEGVISGGAVSKLSGNAQLQFYEEQPIVDWSALKMDSSNADHRLVATAITMRDAGVDPVVLITHDVTPRIAGHLHGLITMDMPAKWRLLSSGDEEDRERRRLQNEVDRLKNRLPIIVVNLPDGDRVQFDCTPLVEPTVDTLDEAVRIESQRYRPKAKLTTKRGLVVGHETDPAEVDLYNQQVAQYPAQLRDWYRDVIAYLVKTRHVVPLDIELSNVGTAPAKNVEIRLTFPDFVDVLHKGDNEIGSPPALLPAPGIQQQGTQSYGLSMLTSHIPYGTWLVGTNVSPIAKRRLGDGRGQAVVRVKKLAHGRPEKADRFWVRFRDGEDVRSFNAEVKIFADELSDPTTQTLHFVAETGEPHKVDVAALISLIESGQSAD